jgi:hypothetical protein
MHVFMPEDQNAGQNNNIKVDNKSFEKFGAVQLFRNKPVESKFNSGRN